MGPQRMASWLGHAGNGNSSVSVPAVPPQQPLAARCSPAPHLAVFVEAHFAVRLHQPLACKTRHPHRQVVYSHVQ